MIDHVILVGGPANGRKLQVNAGLEVATVMASEPGDPGRPRRGQRSRPQKRNCRYRRTDRGVGTGVVPRRYVYVP